MACTEYLVPRALPGLAVGEGTGYLGAAYGTVSVQTPPLLGVGQLGRAVVGWAALDAGEPLGEQRQRARRAPLKGAACLSDERPERRMWPHQHGRVLTRRAAVCSSRAVLLYTSHHRWSSALLCFPARHPNP